MFGNKKGLEHKLREQGGTEAWATILAADEKWASARGGDSGFGGPSHITDHMKVTLQVEPEAEPTFEVTFKQAFPGHTPDIWPSTSSNERPRRCAPAPSSSAALPRLPCPRPSPTSLTS